MSQVICPLDNLPCVRDCPDRYHDTPEGGYFLTTALEMGVNVMVIQEGRSDK